MSIKTFKPVTSTTRKMSVLVFEGAKEPLKVAKRLTGSKPSTAGRNNLGRITSRRRGGGVKRKYRIIDFRRNKYGVEGTVATIDYDPNRSANIAMIKYPDGDYRYILAPDDLKVGDPVKSDDNVPIKPGNNAPLKNIPVGTFIHNIELSIGRGAQMARSAGAYASIVGRDKDYIILKLPSGELRKIHRECRATVGIVGNRDHSLVKLGKAGRSRWMGKRPKVRGVVMNPVDHPHGGGEGRTSGGRHPVTPWGKPTRGKKTRKKNHKTDNMIIQRRKK